MKHNRISLITFLLLCAFITNSFGQDKKPQASQTATFSQKVGFTDVSIVYSRPSKKGRTIFGELVPYDKLWRTGANLATKITFGDDVKIAGNNLSAGSYALFTIPGKDEWTIIFNNISDQGGTGKYDESEDALRVKINSANLSGSVETFTIMIGDVKPSSANINLIWDNTLVSIPLEVSIE